MYMYMYIHNHVHVHVLCQCSASPAALDDSDDNLGNVIAISIGLGDLQQDLENALQQVAARAGQVKEECQSIVNDSICESIPDPDIFVTVANYTMVCANHCIPRPLNLS